MRIAVIVRSLKFGGMEKVALTLSKAFHTQGHESHLIYFNETSDKLPIPKEVHLHSFELKRSMQRSLLGIGYIWRFFSQLLNAIFRNSYFVWSGLWQAAIFQKKLSKIEHDFGTFDLIIFRGQGTFEMIWPIHDDRFVFVNESLIYDDDYGLLKRLYARLLFTNRNIVSISTGVKRSFEQIREDADFTVKKHQLITNPIDIIETRKRSNESFNRPARPYIISVGRFHPVKNFPLLVKAYGYAKEHLGLKHDLVLVGEGEERKKIEKTIQSLLLDETVHLPGYIPNPYPWMKHADLFVLSSTIEGLGMVLLESMACGTDIVATDSPGGIKDVMTDELSTHICKADVVSLAHKIVEVLNKPIDNFSTYLNPYSPAHIANDFIRSFTPKQN